MGSFADNYSQPQATEEHKSGSFARLFAKKPTEPSQESDEVDFTAMGEHFAAGLFPTAAALRGGAIGAELGAPLGLPGVIGGGLIGGLVGGYTGGALQEAILPEDTKEELARTAKESPKSAFAGEMLSAAPFFRPGTASTKFRAVMGGIGGAQEYARERLGGEETDWGRVGMGAAGMAALTKPTGLGTKAAGPALGRVEERLRAKYTPKEDTTGPETIVSTAFKHKETGNVILSGYKHDELIKGDLDQEQGFVTNKGRFVTRREAEQIARKNKQIGKDQLLENPEEGLHSGDLAAAGDEYFKRIPLQELIKRSAEFEKEGHENTPSIPIEQAIKMAREEAEHPSLKLAKDPFYNKGPIQVAMEALNRLRYANDLARWTANDIRAMIPNKTLREFIPFTIEKQKEYHKLLQPAEKAEMLDRMRGGITKYQKNIDKALAEGDTKTAEELSAKLSKLEYALKLREATGEEHKAVAAVEHIEKLLRSVGEQATQSGVLNRGMLRNYIPHVVDFKDSTASPEKQRDLLQRLFEAAKDPKINKDFSLGRQYQYIGDLQKALKDLVALDPEMKGVTVKTDVADIVESYMKSMLTSIIHKNVINHFSNTLGPDGKPFLVRVSEKNPAGYVMFQGPGSKPMEGWLVHPELKDVMEHMFRQKEPGLILRALSAPAMLTKAINTVGSLFHAYSLSTAHAVFDPASALKELFTGGAGIRKAVEAYRSGDPAMREVIRKLMVDGGLVLETEDIKPTIIADIGIAVDKALGMYGPERKGISREHPRYGEELRKMGEEGKLGMLSRHVTDPFDRYFLQKMNALTWDYMHAGQKIHLGINQFAKMKAAHPEMPDADIARAVGEHVNRTFGGLNWQQVAARTSEDALTGIAMKATGIEGRQWAQLLMFAPDWTVSTLKSFTDALPRELAKPSNRSLREGISGTFNPQTTEDLARKYVLHTAIAYLTLLNGINYAASGHFIWDNKDKTRIDLGDGTSMQAAKHSMEFAEWVANPEKTFGNKLGFWPKAVTVATTGVAYPSPDAPRIKDNTIFGRGKAIATLAAPFQISSAVQAPEGQGLTRAALSTIGMPIYGHQKNEFSEEDVRKQRRIERRQKRIENIRKRRERLEREFE